MHISKATAGYEQWLGGHIELIGADLDRKHAAMREAPFPFFRATFYRWMQLWEEVCGDVAKAPEVLAVGDLHVENFGTWRDTEGRLIWGVNDFDEAFPLPYTEDLVRLTASAAVAQGDTALRVSPKDAAAAILEGYTKGLEARGRPFVLAEEQPELLAMARERLKDPTVFWKKLKALPPCKSVPPDAREGMERLLPPGAKLGWFAHRIAGLGSLGRQRFVSIVDWRGGSLAREAKALAPSACVWAGGKHTSPIHCGEILTHAVRCPDPFVATHHGWIVRRLAPDCSRIELSALPKQRDELRLLDAMGRETANVHLGSGSAKALLADLKARPKGWLIGAASAMADTMVKEWKAWSR